MTVPHNWQRSYRTFLFPCLQILDNCKQRACLPKYLRGLLAPLERKSVQPIAEHVDVPYQRLHHFLNVSTWSASSMRTWIAGRAQCLCGGKDSVLIIDDTALPNRSPGVTHQYCGALGKLANCQTIVTLTLSNARLFVPVAMRQFLPPSWIADDERCDVAGIPFETRVGRTKSELALEELDRVIAQGITFDVILADAGYGIGKAFRQALKARGLTWVVGVVGHQKVFRLDVEVRAAKRPTTGRPPKHPVTSEAALPAAQVLSQFPPHKWHTVGGGRISRWLAVRVRVADGTINRRGLHLPGEEVWLIGEKRRGGEVKYYLTNHAEKMPLTRMVRRIKARWACEMMHVQSKEEFGLDHFEGRSYNGLSHHLTLVMLVTLFIQTLRATTLEKWRSAQ